MSDMVTYRRPSKYQSLLATTFGRPKQFKGGQVKASHQSAKLGCDNKRVLPDMRTRSRPASAHAMSPPRHAVVSSSSQPLRAHSALGVSPGAGHSMRSNPFIASPAQKLPPGSDSLQSSELGPKWSEKWGQGMPNSEPLSPAAATAQQTRDMFQLDRLMLSPATVDPVRWRSCTNIMFPDTPPSLGLASPKASSKALMPHPPELHCGVMYSMVTLAELSHADVAGINKEQQDTNDTHHGAEHAGMHVCPTSQPAAAQIQSETHIKCHLQSDDTVAVNAAASRPPKDMLVDDGQFHTDLAADQYEVQERCANSCASVDNVTSSQVPSMQQTGSADRTDAPPLDSECSIAAGPAQTAVVQADHAGSASNSDVAHSTEAELQGAGTAHGSDSVYTSAESTTLAATSNPPAPLVHSYASLYASADSTVPPARFIQHKGQPAVCTQEPSVKVHRTILSSMHDSHYLKAHAATYQLQDTVFEDSVLHPAAANCAPGSPAIMVSISRHPSMGRTMQLQQLYQVACQSISEIQLQALTASDSPSTSVTTLQTQGMSAAATHAGFALGNNSNISADLLVTPVPRRWSSSQNAEMQSVSFDQQSVCSVAQYPGLELTNTLLHQSTDSQNSAFHTVASAQSVCENSNPARGTCGFRCTGMAVCDQRTAAAAELLHHAPSSHELDVVAARDQSPEKVVQRAAGSMMSSQESSSGSATDPGTLDMEQKASPGKTLSNAMQRTPARPSPPGKNSMSTSLPVPDQRRSNIAARDQSLKADKGIDAANQPRSQSDKTKASRSHWVDEDATDCCSALANVPSSPAGSDQQSNDTADDRAAHSSNGLEHPAASGARRTSNSFLDPYSPLTSAHAGAASPYSPYMPLHTMLSNSHSTRPSKTQSRVPQPGQASASAGASSVAEEVEAVCKNLLHDMSAVTLQHSPQRQLQHSCTVSDKQPHQSHHDSESEASSGSQLEEVTLADMTGSPGYQHEGSPVVSSKQVVVRLLAASCTEVESSFQWLVQAPHTNLQHAAAACEQAAPYGMCPDAEQAPGCSTIASRPSSAQQLTNNRLDSYLNVHSSQTSSAAFAACQSPSTRQQNYVVQHDDLSTACSTPSSTLRPGPLSRGLACRTSSRGNQLPGPTSSILPVSPSCDQRNHTQPSGRHPPTGTTELGQECTSMQQAAAVVQLLAPGPALSLPARSPEGARAQSCAGTPVAMTSAHTRSRAMHGRHRRVQSDLPEYYPVSPMETPLHTALALTDAHTHDSPISPIGTPLHSGLKSFAAQYRLQRVVSPTKPLPAGPRALTPAKQTGTEQEFRNGHTKQSPELITMNISSAVNATKQIPSGSSAAAQAPTRSVVSIKQAAALAIAQYEGSMSPRRLQRIQDYVSTLLPSLKGSAAASRSSAQTHAVGAVHTFAAPVTTAARTIQPQSAIPSIDSAVSLHLMDETEQQPSENDGELHEQGLRESSSASRESQQSVEGSQSAASAGAHSAHSMSRASSDHKSDTLSDKQQSLSGILPAFTSKLPASSAASPGRYDTMTATSLQHTNSSFGGVSRASLRASLEAVLAAKAAAVSRPNSACSSASGTCAAAAFQLLHPDRSLLSGVTPSPATCQVNVLVSNSSMQQPGVAPLASAAVTGMQGQEVLSVACQVLPAASACNAMRNAAAASADAGSRGVDSPDRASPSLLQASADTHVMHIATPVVPADAEVQGSAGACATSIDSTACSNAITALAGLLSREQLSTAEFMGLAASVEQLALSLEQAGGPQVS